jgi:hypothetical protein
MKYLKKKKGLYAYSGTDSEAIQFLTAFKQVFGVDLLPFLGDQPISANLATSLRAFEENADDILPEVGTNNRQDLIDSGALPLLFSIQNKGTSLINYIYELKNWHSNKLTTGKIVYVPASFGSPAKYMYLANTVYTPAQKSVIFEKEFADIYKALGGIPANKTAGSIAAWENYLTNPAENSRVKNFDTIYYKGFWADFFAFYKSKRLMAASQGSTTTGGTGAASGTSTGTGTVDTSGGTLNTDKVMTEADMTETDARAFLYEIEKFSPLIWANLDYWYKQLMAKKKEVSKEVFNFAYDYWLKKLNAQYSTFSPLEKENEKERYALINGYIFEKPKKVKKYGLFASILRAIFKKK